MVSYNTREITLQALYGIHKSLQSAWFTTEIKQDVELILVDNASHDGTVEAVQSHLSEFCFSIHIISLRENIGFGRCHCCGRCALYLGDTGNSSSSEPSMGV
jgi:hypothetical protein